MCTSIKTINSKFDFWKELPKHWTQLYISCPLSIQQFLKWGYFKIRRVRNTHVICGLLLTSEKISYNKCDWWVGYQNQIHYVRCPSEFVLPCSETRWDIAAHLQLLRVRSDAPPLRQLASASALYKQCFCICFLSAQLREPVWETPVSSLSPGHYESKKVLHITIHITLTVPPPPFASVPFQRALLEKWWEILHWLL